MARAGGVGHPRALSGRCAMATFRSALAAVLLLASGAARAQLTIAWDADLGFLQAYWRSSAWSCPFASMTVPHTMCEAWCSEGPKPSGVPMPRSSPRNPSSASMT
jgi:hypothetical protein